MALPLLLAGPIVRRVEADLVAVWIATSRPATVRLSIWEGLHRAHQTEPGAVATGAEPLHTVETETLRVGAAFHVALPTIDLSRDAPQPDDDADDDDDDDDVAADPITIGRALLPGQIYAYDVTITPDGGTPSGLRQEGLLQNGPLPAVADRSERPDGVAIGYAGGQLPSFVTCPTALDDLELMHASCRKAARAGDDALTYLDALVERNLSDGTARPHQLFLTGDQIYADDVAGSVLQLALALGHDLLGGFETLPLGGGATVEATGTNLPPLLRQRLSVDTAAFTSGSAHNHLLTFGEYVAMYLLAWSPAVWDRLIVDDSLFSGAGSAVPDHLGTWRKKKDWERADLELRAAEQAVLAATGSERPKREAALRRLRERKIEPLVRGGTTSGPNPPFADEGFRDQVARVRRLLANVATYMVFDDHEITDDWNLTAGWRDRVLASSLGNAVVTNGLLAFALCQSWGNDPRGWAKGKNRELLDAVAELYPDPAGGPLVANAEAAAKVSGLLGHDGSSPDVAWHFRVDGPAHRVVALDTRTRREFASRTSPPALLSEEDLNSQLPAGPLQPPQEVLVVVSAVPVGGPLVIDHIVQPLGAALASSARAFGLIGKGSPEEPELFGAAQVDRESWVQSDEAFERLLARLAGYPRVVILSGDVHFAATMTIDYYRKSGDTYRASRFAQLTSSAARNAWPLIVRLLFRDLVPAQALIGQAIPGERLGWTTNLPPPLRNVDRALVRHRGRLRTEPVLAPGRGWPEETEETRGPDFAWRLDFVDDMRAELDRPPQVRVSALDDPAGDPLGGYRDVAAAHAAAIDATAQTRRMVFLHNAGLVAFERDDDGLTVRHELWSRNERSPLAVGPDRNTLHRILLEPPDGSTRPRIGPEP